MIKDERVKSKVMTKKINQLNLDLLSDEGKV